MRRLTIPSKGLPHSPPNPKASHHQPMGVLAGFLVDPGKYAAGT